MTLRHWALVLFLLLAALPGLACEDAQQVAGCQCGCGGTPRPYCAHRDCACAKTGLALPKEADRLTAGCQCGCGGTPRPACAHKGCVCSQTTMDGKPAAVFQDPTQGDTSVAGCSCGCGGTPRPYCAHRGCVCSSTGAAPAEKADALSKGCQCGCGGTAQPACAHRGCQCAETSLAGGQAPKFLDPTAPGATAAACQCGCGGTPRPACAHRGCLCGQTDAADPARAATLAAGCQCGCGGTPQPACAHRDCQCAKVDMQGKPAGAMRTGPDVVALAQLASTGVRLVGDGATTSHTTLQLSNPGKEALTVSIPAYTQFAPRDAAMQALTTVEPALATVPPGETVEVRLETVCSSRRSQPPPGKQGGVYSVTEPPPYVQSIVETSLQLAERGAYDSVPMSRCKALQTVRQMALWMEAAGKSPDPGDQVTPETVAEQVYTQLGKRPEELTPKQREQVEEGAQNIFEAVDLTVKTSREGGTSGRCVCPEQAAR